jgi:hypothetical protein
MGDGSLQVMLLQWSCVLFFKLSGIVRFSSFAFRCRRIATPVSFRRCSVGRNLMHSHPTRFSLKTHLP